MSVPRFIKHFFTTSGLVNKYFPEESMRRITEAISESEKQHDAELVFAIESSISPISALRGYTARERAIDVFSELRIWDTEWNNGVMIYLLLADHDIEIVADRGVNRLAGSEYWEDVCHGIEKNFKEGRFEEGVIFGIRKISELLIQNYPKTENNPNELPNEPYII